MGNIIDLLIRIDYLVLEYFRSFSNPLTQNLFLLITILGSASFLILLVVILWLKGNKKISIILFIALLINLGLISSLKILVGRIRPETSVTTRGMSFPSGHTSNAFIVAYILSNYFNKKKYLFTLAFLVGLSRVWLRAHYFSDVLVGAILGIMIGWFVLRYKEKGILLSKKLEKLFSINLIIF